MKFFLWCACLPCAVGLCLSATAQNLQTNILVDTGGFEDADIYPLGNLGSVQDGAALWQPASSPAQIVLASPDHSQVLRRSQTGSDNTDYVSFPAVSSGVLTVQFDARASTNGARTLDVVLLPASGSLMASMLGWGTVSNKFCYYDGTNWVPLLNLDTNWHHFEAVNFMSGSNFGRFDLKVDDAVIGNNLRWRDNFAAGSPFSRLRIGGIRGPKGQYGDVDNLVVTAVTTNSTPEALVLTNPVVHLTNFSFGFDTRTDTEYMVESTASVSHPNWSPAAIVAGDGLPARFTNAPLSESQQYFRVSRLPPAGYSDGYRGIWFTLGQFSEYGDKYSGGLGTYTANHIPVAIYAPEVNKTFFVYGGTIKEQRHLLIMASCFDHATGRVPRPTLVLDKGGVNDPHDNAALAIDQRGYIWIFVSGRATARPGWKFRSRQPYSVAAFDFIRQDEMTYPQPRFIPGFGFFNLFTKYTNGRELYWESSVDGTNWSAHHKLAGIGGHYQVSNVRSDDLIATFFNRHPGGNVDQRTDLYYLQTTNFGTTWTTASGQAVAVPLTTTNNPARVFDYAAEGKLMYTCDLNFDTNGRPVLLYVTSHDYRPGPNGDPRDWVVSRWNGSTWLTSVVCQSDHNYDMGSLYITPSKWAIIGPTQNGPQLWQAGGEMALWESLDQGATWTMVRQITSGSVANHTYARRPLNATDPFYVFWADGNPTNFTPSHLYFGNSTGTHVWTLPYDMSDPIAFPLQVK